jgi:hypothetical protein
MSIRDIDITCKTYLSSRMIEQPPLRNMIVGAQENQGRLCGQTP